MAPWRRVFCRGALALRSAPQYPKSHPACSEPAIIFAVHLCILDCEWGTGQAQKAPHGLRDGNIAEDLPLDSACPCL